MANSLNDLGSISKKIDQLSSRKTNEFGSITKSRSATSNGRSLSEFASIIKTRNVAPAARFEVQVYPPPFMMNEIPSVANDSQYISILAEMIQMPEFVLSTIDIRDTGEKREVVCDKTYPPIVATFICDGKMDVKNFFDAWTMGTMLTQSGTFRYPADYTANELVILQLDMSGTPVYEVTLTDVYPKIVNDIALSSSSKDYNRCQVQFVYRNWVSRKV